MRGKNDYFKPGDRNAICDGCGFKFKASQLRKRWDGYMVCEDDWEPRHPQDLVEARIRRNISPDTRSTDGSENG